MFETLVASHYDFPRRDKIKVCYQTKKKLLNKLLLKYTSDLKGQNPSTLQIQKKCTKLVNYMKYSVEKNPALTCVKLLSTNRSMKKTSIFRWILADEPKADERVNYEIYQERELQILFPTIEQETPIFFNQQNEVFKENSHMWIVLEVKKICFFSPFFKKIKLTIIIIRYWNLKNKCWHCLKTGNSFDLQQELNY